MSQDTVPAVLDEETVETNNSVVDVSAAASMLGRMGAHTKWANCPDRSAATAPARAALEQKFLDQAGGDPVRAESFRKLYYTRLARKSAAARRARKGVSAA